MVRSRFTRTAVVAAAVTLLAACGDTTLPTAASPDALASRATAPGQDRIEEIFQRTSPEVMALPGTVFSDNDEVRGKLVIGVENMNAVRGVELALARMGVARADYEVELTQPIHFAATLRDRFRPTVAGIQIHFSRYVCTMGFNVSHAGGRSFITNSHCTTRQGGTEGTLYYQPSSSADPTAIATEVDDPVYVKGGSCPKGKACRHSDASRALYDAGTASNQGEIAKTTGVNNGSLTVAGIFSITAQDNATKNYPVGTVVNKVGRTTGWTSGQVTRSCVNTSVSGSTVYLYCQTFVSDAGGATVVGGGDSGSGVFSVTSGDSVKLLGILWGGSSDNKQFVFSPLASIQQELGAVTATK